MAQFTEPERVEVGELVTLSAPDTRRPVNGMIREVQPACDDKTNGRWYCVVHRASFANQLQKDLHLSEQRSLKSGCRLAWVCMTHGLERP